METMDPETEPQEEYMGVDETAARLKVSVSTVRRYMTEGKLDGYRTQGGHRRFTRASVERLHAETVGQAEASG